MKLHSGRNDLPVRVRVAALLKNPLVGTNLTSQISTCKNIEVRKGRYILRDAITYSYFISFILRCYE